ncbi:MAG: hypothetical protein E3J78_01800, partial [Candidatus Cloacimonadota bacterium]
MTEDYEYEDIEQDYKYDKKRKHTSVRFFPDKNIATVTKSEFEGEEAIEVAILVEGMTKDELERYFPPLPAHRKQGHTYSLARIVRSVIYEAFTKEGEDIEGGNVRHFWYTHLKKFITEILGLGETDVVLGTINTAWGEMINSGLVTYEGMNIIGGKENVRLSVVKDSPFSNLIIAVEKVDYFYTYQWIPRLFNSTLITAGGQPSRTVARAFIRQLKDLGVDLDQQFYMCTISDLDPAGYYIQDAFRKQFESAIEYYGGSGAVSIERLFVREDQITPDLLKAQAMPCQDKAKGDKARKAENTKWEYFCSMTNGGIYMPDPPGWTGPVYEKDGQHVVRALLEMTAFSKEIIERSIIRELLKIIKETNDESKILIPEIMRIFEEQKDEVSDEQFEKWRRILIQPLISQFLSDTNKWRYNINDTYNTQYNEIDDKYQEKIDEQLQESREREPDLYEKKDDLEAKIKALKEELDIVDGEIGEKCADIFELIDDLESKRDDEFDEIQEQKDYRMEKLEEFKDEKSTVFNPLEQGLKADIKEFIQDAPELQLYFIDIEQMNRFKPHIGRLLTQPKLLLEEDVSCFDQPISTFKEKDLLQKASSVKDENVGKVRNAFPKVFTDEMKLLI